MESNKLIYALDFDGVICDSTVETAITGWNAARTLWPEMPEAVPPAMIETFRTFRPLIETGYEAILIMRLISQGASFQSLANNYHDTLQALIDETGVAIDDLKKLFGATRDYWIKHDLADWIAKNPLYSGVAERLLTVGRGNPWYVVTTKHERFVNLILQSNRISLPEENIYGLDRNMSKTAVLHELMRMHPDAEICFVEDRLPTLTNILNNEALARVRLVFATWGYNTAIDKETAAGLPLVSQKLEQFLS
jgi:hypothetical protein